MVLDTIVKALNKKYNLLKSEFDERSRRLWAASEAVAIVHGGISAVVRATGIVESTIRIGKRELEEKLPKAIEPTSRHIRRKGGGRKNLTDHDNSLLFALDALVEPTARGDPMSPLRWTCKSTHRLSAELKRQGHSISHTKSLSTIA